NFNEFELHLRAVLGLPIEEITLERAGASSVILASDDNQNEPTYRGIEEAVKINQTDLKIFSKPNTRMYRRMGVGLAYGKPNADVNELRKKAKEAADCVSVNGK
ncbi:MAG: phosphoribosylglycinamide formyltransferase 2, partial [Saprospiraceae bacterium]